jgi:hypothetical protein
MPHRSEEARLRAEANFKMKQQRTEEGEKVWGEHLAAGEAADANRAKLKAQRLARDAPRNPPLPKVGPERKSRPPAPKGRRSAHKVRWTTERDVGPDHMVVRNNRTRCPREL